MRCGIRCGAFGILLAVGEAERRIVGGGNPIGADVPPRGLSVVPTRRGALPGSRGIAVGTEIGIAEELAGTAARHVAAGIGGGARSERVGAMTLIERPVRLIGPWCRRAHRCPRGRPGNRPSGASHVPAGTTAWAARRLHGGCEMAATRRWSARVTRESHALALEDK